jgi:hypothetical protein
MNYLKSYKVFESSHIDSKLTDCLVELFDYGFEIEHVESLEPQQSWEKNTLYLELNYLKDFLNQ